MKKYVHYIVGFVIGSLLFGFTGVLAETVDIVFNSINITVNGQKVNADNILYKGTTYVPLRSISEILDKEVDYDSETKTAKINDKKPIINNEKEEPKTSEKDSQAQATETLPLSNELINKEADVKKEDTYENLTLASNFTYNDLEITVGNQVRFTKFFNNYDKNYNKTVVKLRMSVKNLADKSSGLAPFSFNVIAPDGSNTDVILTYYDDNINKLGDLNVGAKKEGVLYFIYQGNGDYKVNLKRSYNEEPISILIPVDK